jgi:DNA-binding response OmpR family regulator
MAGSTILVVEDHRPLAAMLERVLGAERYDVDVAVDGNEALRRARERPFDLVVLDLMLPGLDGIAVCRRLRATSSIPILVLTARGRTEDRVLGLDSGADDYVAKPFHNEELLARVRALLRRTASRPAHRLQRRRGLADGQRRPAGRGDRPSAQGLEPGVCVGAPPAPSAPPPHKWGGPLRV